MESHGLPGTIHLSSSMEEHLRHSFVLEARGTLEIKGQGPMETFVLLAEKT